MTKNYGRVKTLPVQTTLRMVILLLLDVANGATLPVQTSYDNIDQSRYPRLTNSPHVPQTHIRITRPPYDSAVSQSSPQNVQFASSPTSDYYGGSVYSDGNGILVRPQADDISYQHQQNVRPAAISYFPSYPQYDTYVYPNTRYESRLPPSGLHYYVTQPVKPTRDVLMHGLGRVLPVNRDLRKPAENVNRRDNDVLMFTLGRIMGQLNNMNNETKMGPFLEYALSLQQPQKPKFPWGDELPRDTVLQSMLWGATTNPTIWSNPTWTRPAYPRLNYPSTPIWWQPSYSPWHPDRPWWANIYQQQEQPKPWWFALFANSLDGAAGED